MDTKKLRQKILDLAIRGKLVPQDPSDEPASVLLERIKAEKERLIKEGKIKRSKKTAKTSDTPHYGNVPFEIPDNWEWTTINAISKSILYGVSESAKTNGKYRLLRITDIQNNSVQWDSVPYTDFDENKVKSYLLSEGDILFARTGATVGKSYLVQELAEEAIYASYLIRVQTYDAVLPQYVKFYFESGYYWEQIEQGSVGVGQPNVNGTILGNLHIPIPPMHEQYRIVSELLKWMGIIDVIELGKTDLQTIIKQAKSKILDLAIQGKLVAQDPSDEPASELLKRINPKAEITCDNAHYPKVWQKTILGDIFNHNTGKALNSSNKEGIMKDYLTTSNVYWNKFDFSVIKQMPYKESELDKCTVTKGDLLVCEGGDIGRAAIWNYDFDICIQNHIHRLRPKGELCVAFYYYILLYLKENNLIGGKGIGLLGLSSNALHKIDVPLPPIEEQYRIVQKIEELFSYFDNIQKTLEA
ncbi:restriction endonuclease subunit S [Phocaeicola coprophilus]|uniref:Restriction endonuclease subunit S n=1 Tax=Phocaeicola coprophilus TaxID=387090 RepID=A0A413T077_9BACT|nr:restriction endonuclease subunit S [Phocaeicola coprophilus]RHA75865.1 restriction endonuclease subunit S [Phocaeicola coprophilus]